MTSFFNALGQGYSPQQILSYLSQAIPQFSPMIKKAQKAGYPAAQIVGFLSKNFETEDRQGLSESQRHAVNRRADAERTKFGLKLAATAIATPIAARAAQGVLSRALPQSLAAGIGQTLPPNNSINPGAAGPLNTGLAPNQGIAPTGMQPPQASSSQPPILPNAAQTPTTPNITETPIVNQDQIKTNDLMKIFDKYKGFTAKVDDLIKTNNPPESISAFFKKFNPEQTKKIEKEAGVPIEEIISEYMASKPLKESSLEQPIKTPEEIRPEIPLQQPKEVAEEILKEEEIPQKQEDVKPLDKGINDLATQSIGNDFREAFKTLEGGTATKKLYEGIFDSLQKGKDTFAGIKDPLLAKAKPLFDKGLIKSPDDIRKLANEGIQAFNQDVKPLDKGSTVLAPQGVGEVKEIRNGKAMIEVDGKKHVVDETELEPEPEEVKEAKFDFNVDDIPEDERSAVLNEVYIPHDKRHISVKYNSGLKPVRYIYYRKDDQPIASDFINKIYEGVELPVTSGLNFWGGWNSEKSDSRGSANYHELVANAQREGEPDNPDKDYWFYEEEAVYTHPYMKRAKEILLRKEKEFNEKHKKPRATKKPKKPKKPT